LITTDLKNTSPDQTLTVAPPGNWTVGQFLSELAGLKTDAAASKVLAAMTNDAAGMTQSLSQLSGAGGKLGGLAYSPVYGAYGGTALLVYQDTSPPQVDATGQVTAGDGTLVLTPGQWVGTKLIPLTVLNVVIQKDFSIRLRRSRSGPTVMRCQAGRSLQTRPPCGRRASSTTAGLTRAPNQASATERRWHVRSERVCG